MAILKPLYLAGAGVVVLVGGFLYDMLFAGLPFQDPSPEVAAAWRLQGAIAGRIMLAGLVLVACGGLLGAFRLVASRRKGR